MSSAQADQCLELLFLGGFDVRLKGRPLTGNAYAKMRALLAYLAVERDQDHPREALAELLWSGNDPTTARGNLRRTLSDLRNMLELPAKTELFSTSKHSIRFLPKARVDVADFICRLPSSGLDENAMLDEKARIVALYRGEFLAGLSLPDSPAFDDWLLVQREALHRHALALLEHLSNSLERHNAHDNALQFAVRQTELAPWDEDAHRRVIRLYALNGQTGAALAQYDVCRRQLKEGLGVLPSKETGELVERIRNGELRPEAVVSSETPTAPITLQLQSERRQVTVLYCELTFPEIDDPDETMTLLHAPQAHCMEIIRRHTGHVMQAYGGGLLAYFGYPRADEHASRHAVRAALAVVACAATDRLEIRVGVHTGLVVTGGESGLPDISGRTSRLAVLLRNFAPHNEVVISRETHDIVAGYFECVPLDNVNVPGLARPIEVFRAVRETGVKTRVDAAIRLTPLVGRQSDVAMLMAAWEAAAGGAGHAMLIRGEPGLGKTRLVHTLKQGLAGRPHVIRELRCFPESSQSPFHPLIAMFEGILAFTPDDSPETRFAKLVAYVDAHYPAEAHHAIPVLAHLLSLSFGDDIQVAELSPKRQKDQTLAILLHLLRALAAEQPVLFIVEDLHWVDPSTLELLTLFVESTGRYPILALFTARPEFMAPWLDACTTLSLAPLVDEDIAAMVAALDEDIPAPTVRRIVERADGVPLFAEEMAKIATVNKDARVPATLLDLLMARMDGMGEAKRTAQLAATLGREFDPALLGRLSAAAPELLARYLAALQDAGLVLETNTALRQFKHALIQEVAYQSQSMADRQAAHRRIADVLRSDFSEVVATQPELLARHLAGAGETWLAVSYWTLAGQRAAHQSANLEAAEHFRAALRLLEALPEDQERNKAEFNVLVNLFPVLYATEGYGSKETSRANARIATLSQLVGDSPDLFPAKWTVLVNTIGSVGPRGVPEAVAQLLPMAQGDPIREHAAHHLGANCCFWLGEFEASLAHYQHSAALFRPEHAPLLIAQYGTDLSVFNASHGMFALHMLGHTDQAQAICAQSVERARATSHAHTLAQALSFAAVLQRWQSKPEAALALSTEAIAIAREQDFPLWEVSAGMSSGWARVVLGDGEAGIAEIKSSIDGMRLAIGGISVIFLAALIHTHIFLKRYDDALATVAEALADAERNGDGHYLAELYRLKAECLLARFTDRADEAVALLDEALAIARRQRARTHELRVATTMAYLMQRQGQGKAAQALLAKVVASFTEGFATHDFLYAASMLSDLRSR